MGQVQWCQLPGSLSRNRVQLGPVAMSHPAVLTHVCMCGQIVLYLLSRIIIAWCKNLAAQGVKPFCMTTFKSAYPFLAAAVWANVMYLFEARRGTLHKSLARSMDFLYHDSNRWQTLSDFLPSPATVAVLVYYFFYVRVKSSAAASQAAKAIPRRVPTGV